MYICCSMGVLFILSVVLGLLASWELVPSCAQPFPSLTSWRGKALCNSKNRAGKITTFARAHSLKKNRRYPYCYHWRQITDLWKLFPESYDDESYGKNNAYETALNMSMNGSPKLSFHWSPFVWPVCCFDTWYRTYVNRGERARSCLSPGTGNGHWRVTEPEAA